jgi:hypothetical protein
MALTQTQVSQLYVAIFNRASEGEGNQYWQTQPDAATAATVMLDTIDAKQYFGSSLDSDQAFIEHIYLNTLNKALAMDPDGIAYWTGRLEEGAARGQIVAELVAVIENYAPGGPYHDPSDAATVAAYNQFVNRVEISDYMAEQVFDTPADYAVSTAFDKNLPVTDDPVTVTAARSAVDQLAGNSESIDVSVDTGTLDFPGYYDAGTGAFNFMDDPMQLTHVVIDNFSSDDLITLMNAVPGDYSFSNDGEDVYMILNNDGIINHITLTGVVDGGDVVHDSASFAAAMGFDPVAVS